MMYRLYPMLNAPWERITYSNGKPNKTFIGAPKSFYFQNKNIDLLGQAVTYKSGKIHFFALCALVKKEVVIPNQNISLHALDSYMNTLGRLGTEIPKSVTKKREIISNKIYALHPYAVFLPDLSDRLKLEWTATLKPHHKNRMTEFCSKVPFNEKAKFKALKSFKQLEFDVNGLILCEFDKKPTYYFLDARLKIINTL